uniref:Zinc finger protein 687a n=1 Tax=Tetraodon nigroviridis TaxID=99883 RepID=H3DLW2_TETNG
MGDMKTPDFDDLLAAFDIPDVEAIQSSPEDEQNEIRSAADEGMSGAPPCFPCPPVTHSDPPVVSVIVKNTVRSESFDEERCVRDTLVSPSNCGLNSHVQVESQMSNGFEESIGDQGHSSSHAWSVHSAAGPSPRPRKGERDKGDEVESIQHTADVITSLKPLLYPQTSSSPSIKTPVSPFPSQGPHQEDTCLSNPSASLPQNGTMSSPPKFKRRAKVQHPDLPGPPETTSSLVSPPDHFPLLTSVKHPVLEKKEEYPEHVIEERDSPESPPPSPRQELMESEFGEENRQNENEQLRENVALRKEGCDADTETVTSGALSETDSPPLHPLKVKIKMQSGGITKAVSASNPKRTGKSSAKSVDAFKVSPESNLKSRAEQQTTVATELQDGTSAAKEAANETVDKPVVTPTAVNLTRTAALPSITASLPRVSASSLGLRNLSSAPSQLHLPQSSNKPASIVNSTGAIISKSQTSLVEAFNKILNNRNPLPSYKPDLSTPPPAEWGLPLPAQGYRCLECGDAFALEQSLVRHYSRRSLRIEVTCNQCTKRLAFFNKCSLLLHAREHKEKGLIMQCSHLVMKPVPVEQMIGQPDSVAMGRSRFPNCNILNGLSPLLSSSGQLSVLGQAAPNPKPTPRKIFSSKKKETAQNINYKCPECQIQFGSKEELVAHFQELQPAQITSCKECSPPMLLSNICSAASHQRIHRGSKPHTCPECGSSFEQPLFQTHLSQTCLHFSRRIGYRCYSCLVVFGGLNSVKSHIQQAHCDVFHKCPSCPMAFKSAPSIQSHIASQHPALTDRQTTMIFKCVMCDTVFTNKTLLHTHFETHLTNQKVHVFKCPECTKLFSQRNSLLEHFKVYPGRKEGNAMTVLLEVSSPIHKTSTLKKELPSSAVATSHSRAPLAVGSPDGEMWMDENKGEMMTKEKFKNPSGWKCALCQERYQDREVYVSHMAEQHGKTLKKFPCNKCENSFTTTSSLRRHIRDKHKGTNRGFCCQLCSDGKKTFSSRAMLEKHIQLRHRMDGGSQDTLMDTRVKARSKKRGAVKTEQDEESADGPSPSKKSQPPSASASCSQPESGFRCAPCGYSTEDQALFLEHIGQHRRGGAEGGGDQQCLQCGACFTSASSMARHCFIAHKVRKALTSATTYEKSFLDGSMPASPLSKDQTDDEPALTCKVCHKRFDKISDLNTHFRTHGMAFISARNTGKT